MYLFAFILQVALVNGYVVSSSGLGKRGVAPQQEILAEAGSGRGKFSTPVKSLNGIFYTIDVAVGTPPQLFNVTLDLMNGGLFLPSINCDSSCTTTGSRRSYDRYTSTTSKSKGKVTWQEFFGHNYFGDLVRDNVHLDGLKFPETTFLEYDWRSDGSPFKLPDDGFDGMIGLGPPWVAENGYHRTEYSSLLSQLHSEQLLDEKIFSLALPRGMNDEGEIMFGGKNPDLYSGNFITLDVEFDPATRDVSDPSSYHGLWIPSLYNGLWTIPIGDIILHTPTPYRARLPERAVTMLMSEPYMIFPESLRVQDFYHVIGAEWIDRFWASVPCERRTHLPDLSFEIGGHNLTISAFDYTFEHYLEGPYRDPACLLWILNHEDTNLPSNVVALGAHFLKAFYTVFDFGESRVQFAKRK